MDDTANDFAGTNHGSIQGNTAVNQTGKMNGAFAFDGYEDRVIVTPITLNGDWSIAYWYYQNAADKIIMGQAETDNNRFYHYTATLYHIKFNDSSHDFFAFTQSLNSWHHVVVTRQGSTVTVYKDGAYSDSKTISNANFIFDSIGDGYGGGTYDWNGMIDDVRIYNGALSAPQVSALYNEAFNATPTHTHTPLNTPTALSTPTAEPTPDPDNINTIANFPDPNFKAAVEAFMGKAPDEPFTADDAATKVGFMNISNWGIFDLTGIQYFTDITRLKVSNNYLESLYINNNSALIEVIADNNLLGSIDLSNNYNLEYIDLSENRLTDLSSILINDELQYGDIIKVTNNYLNLDSEQTELLIDRFKHGISLYPQYKVTYCEWEYNCLRSSQPELVNISYNAIQDIDPLDNSYSYYSYNIRPILGGKGIIDLRVEFDSGFDNNGEFLDTNIDVETRWLDYMTTSNGCLKNDAGIHTSMIRADLNTYGSALNDSNGTSESALDVALNPNPGGFIRLNYHAGIWHDHPGANPANWKEYQSHEDNSSLANWVEKPFEENSNFNEISESIDYGSNQNISIYSLGTYVDKAFVSVSGGIDYIGYARVYFSFDRIISELTCKPYEIKAQEQEPVPTSVTPYPTPLETPLPIPTAVPTATKKPLAPNPLPTNTPNPVHSLPTPVGLYFEIIQVNGYNGNDLFIDPHGNSDPFQNPIVPGPKWPSEYDTNIEVKIHNAGDLIGVDFILVWEYKIEYKVEDIHAPGIKKGIGPVETSIVIWDYQKIDILDLRDEDRIYSWNPVTHPGEHLIFDHWGSFGIFGPFLGSTDIKFLGGWNVKIKVELRRQNSPSDPNPPWPMIEYVELPEYKIRGINPDEALVKQYIDFVMVPEGIWFGRHIAQHEQYEGDEYKQFLSNGAPIFNNHDTIEATDGGIGMFQLTPPDSYTQFWNWQQNIIGAKNRLVKLRDYVSPKPEGRGATQFWEQQVNQFNAWNDDPENTDVSEPSNHVEGNITFKYIVNNDDNPLNYQYNPNNNIRSFRDAIWIKQFNGASPNYISWLNTGQFSQNPKWSINVGGNNYVFEISSENVN